jgi:uncharacterized protein YqgV (UPF0045/DUF77 family)
MMDISAQVSLYPLRQPDLSSAIDDALKIFHTHGLRVVPGSMSTVITGGIDEVFGGLREALQRATDEGEVVMAVTFSNACPVPRGLPDQAHRGGERAGAPRPRLSGSPDDERFEGD